jgi:hypothetical protein
MSSHTGSELREAARTLAAVVPVSARRPAPAPEPVEAAGEARIFDHLADAA